MTGRDATVRSDNDLDSVLTKSKPSFPRKRPVKALTSRQRVILSGARGTSPECEFAREIRFRDVNFGVRTMNFG